MNNTIFDDVFRTMIEKMPYLAVPLINEVFHTSYPENVPIVQLRNEHQQEDGEIITDSCLKIAGKLYHPYPDIGIRGIIPMFYLFRHFPLHDGIVRLASEKHRNKNPTTDRRLF